MLKYAQVAGMLKRAADDYGAAAGAQAPPPDLKEIFDRYDWSDFVDSLTGAKPSRPSYSYSDQASRFNNVVKRYPKVWRRVPRGGRIRVEDRSRPPVYVPASGGLGGPGYNMNYTTANAKPGQRAIIAVSGARLGESWGIADDLGIPENRMFKFRYNDAAQAEALAKELMDKGIETHIIGQSRGGDAADEIGSRLQAQGYKPKVTLLDPVNKSMNFIPFLRTRKPRTKGANVFMPDKPGMFSGGFNWPNFVATLGGRFDTSSSVTGTWKGDHSDGMIRELMRVIGHPVLARKLSPRRGKE